MKEVRDAIGDGLIELGSVDERIVALDSDLSKSTRTAKFGEKFPNRFFNMGISEQDMICTAAGLSLAGYIPFASTFALFAMGRAWEQIRNTVSRSNLNVKIAVSHAGVSPFGDGPSHQSFEDIACARVLPNFRVIVPADYEEAMQAMRWAAKIQGPVYLRMVRGASPIVSKNFEVGKAQVLKIGEDVSILACGPMVHRSLIAAEMLEKEGISTEVINVSTIKPLDSETIVASAKKTGLVVTAEEHNTIGGLGGAVAELLSEKHPTRMARVGVKDRFGSSARSEAEVVKLLGLTENDIYHAVKQAQYATI